MEAIAPSHCAITVEPPEQHRDSQPMRTVKSAPPLPSSPHPPTWSNGSRSGPSAKTSEARSRAATERRAHQRLETPLFYRLHEYRAGAVSPYFAALGSVGVCTRFRDWENTQQRPSTPLGKCESHAAEVYLPGRRTPQNRESVFLRRKPPRGRQCRPGRRCRRGSCRATPKAPPACSFLRPPRAARCCVYSGDEAEPARSVCFSGSSWVASVGRTSRSWADSCTVSLWHFQRAKGFCKVGLLRTPRASLRASPERHMGVVRPERPNSKGRQQVVAK